MAILKKIIKFLRSIPLAIILLCYIVIMSILASPLQQDMDPGWYSQHYPGLIGWLIIKTHFYSFYSSVLYLIPALLFFINLLLCTIHRITKRFRNRAPLRFGPDLIHIGLLVILIGGSISLLTRGEDYYLFSRGDSVELPGEYILRLKSFEHLTYDDGRTKDWLSNMEIEKNGELIRTVVIEVNKPLRLGPYTIYQHSCLDTSKVYLHDSSGTMYEVEPGYGFTSGKYQIVFRTLATFNDLSRDTVAVFDKYLNNKRIESYKITQGEMIGDYLLVEYSQNLSSRLQFVSDFGILPIRVGLILIFAGLMLTFGQKMREEKE